ncbi:MAG: hypothetical protein KDA93_19210 [Planctomycetaceae bacterium]|nr:hypothetical protein [Planctomycetaceae bacterium]
MAESSFSRLQRNRQKHREQLISLAWGLPAAITIVVCLILLQRADFSREKGGVRRHYQKRLEQAAEREDWAQVELFSRKLSVLEPHDETHRYHLALAIDEQGDKSRAIHLMETIAPRDERGFGLAHWWLARHWASLPEGNSENGLSAQNWHLKQFLRSDPYHLEARIALGRTEAALGNLEVAMRHLQRVVNQKPDLHLVLARLSRRIGDEVAVKQHVQRAMTAYEDRLSQNAADIDARLHLADALSLIQRPEEAAILLEEGLRRYDLPELRAGLARLCLHSADVIASHTSTPQALHQQLSLIERALVLQPGDSEALKRLARIVVSTEAPESPATEMLQECLAAGTAPAVVHMVLGTHALGQEDVETATLHFEAAHQLQPEFPACMNNLAWSLARSQPPQLLRASQLSEKAVTLAPGRPEFHETRGQIRLLQGRYREAIPDLEFGLRSDGDTSVTHASLAEVYDALGQQELAEKHRLKAKSLAEPE